MKKDIRDNNKLYIVTKSLDFQYADIYMGWNYLFTIEVFNDTFSENVSLNTSKKNKNYLLLCAILRRWGLTQPLIHINFIKKVIKKGNN